MKPVVLLDTNVWVSAFLNKQGPPARVVQAWLDGDFDAVIGLPVLEEISEVLRRPRIKEKYKVREEDLVQYLQLIAAGAAIVTVSDVPAPSTGMSGYAACARSRGSGAGSARTRPLSPSATESSSTTCKSIT